MKTSLQKGFSLIEMIIYVAILSLVMFFVVNTLLSFNSTYREVRMQRSIDTSALMSLERMTRDIRLSKNIVVSQSSFNTPSGILALYSVDGQVSTTTRFYLKNNVLQVDLNGVYSGPLTLAQVSVTNLTFNRLVSTSSEAVKIDMTLKYVYGSITRQKNYQTTVVLKGV
jgi:prepilin-type N-terminal cleavage/methylation domain-containing protein